MPKLTAEGLVAFKAAYSSVSSSTDQTDLVAAGLGATAAQSLLEVADMELDVEAAEEASSAVPAAEGASTVVLTAEAAVDIVSASDPATTTTASEAAHILDPLPVITAIDEQPASDKSTALNAVKVVPELSSTTAATAAEAS